MSDAYTGEIRLFAGHYAPENWHFCDGSQVAIAAYQPLYSLIGTTYGGTSTQFGLPNLSGRLPIGTGQGPDATIPAYTLGHTGGAEGVTLQPANLPAHTHAISASSTPATTSSPGMSVTFATLPGNDRFYVDTSQGTVMTTVDFSPAAISSQGGGAAHTNVMPCAPLSYIICLTGIYPEQA